MRKLSEKILEERMLVKRRHTDEYPSVAAPRRADIRNKILSHIYEQELHRISRDELVEYLKAVKEGEGEYVHPSWINKNEGKYIRKIKVAGKTYYKLTRAGMNLVEKIKD